MDDFFTAFFKTGKLRHNNRHLVLKNVSTFKGQTKYSIFI